MKGNQTMKDKVVLITGATSGIGKETAFALSSMGATLVVVGRNRERGEAICEEIKRRSGSDSVELIVADLSSLSEVRGVAKQFLERHRELHVLINNAGFATKTRQTTAEGMESQWAVNYLAPFLLTSLLLDCMKQSTPSRIINVSASLHAWDDLDFDDMEMQNDYKGVKMYARTKAALNSFTFELARRVKGDGITVNCLHPGVVKTGFPAGALFPMSVLFRPFFLSPKKGARNTIYLASSSEVAEVTGAYYNGMNISEASETSRDPEKAKRLFDKTLKQVGLTEDI